jgi:CBS domain-containing protein
MVFESLRRAIGSNGIQINAQFWLAVAIIIPAFILIAYMLSIQDNTSRMIANNLFSNTSQLSGSNLTNVREMISEFDRSNTTLFNILLPVFGAWVGVVVTFYFGSEQARKAQETLAQALSPEAKLSTIKVEQALSRFEEAKKIITATLKGKVIDVRNKLENLSNVLVLDDNGKPIGILYKADLYSQKDIAKSNVGDFDNITLENFITDKELIDHITKRKWEKDKPIKNFATINPENTLLHARERMYGISTTDLDVLCVVVDKDGKPIGIIGFDIINYYLQ